MPELTTLGVPIKATYEAEPNTNAFTDAEKEKLAGIEAEATKNASDADLLNRANHTGSQTAGTIIDLPDLLADKVSVVPGKGLSDANFTQDEKDKLAQLEGAHFKGVHMGLASLENAHPTAVVGDYAVVDDGVDILWYQWDATGSEWVVRAGEGAEITPAQVKTYYESNPDTNVFTDDEKAGLASLISEQRFTLRRRGTWNAETNTPTLADGEGTPGDFYVVTAGGSRNFGTGVYNFQQGDWVIYAGGTWQRITVRENVNSVNGKTGPVTLDADDVGALSSDYVPMWDDIQDKPAVYVTRGPISPPIPALYARNGAAVAVPSNTSTDYPLNADVFDSFGMLSDGKMVVPAWANRFRVTACINFAANATGRRQASVFVNGGSSTTTRVMAAPDAITSVPLMTPVRPVNPGDILDIKVFQTSGVELDVSNTSWVQVELFE